MIKLFVDILRIIGNLVTGLYVLDVVGVEKGNLF